MPLSLGVSGQHQSQNILGQRYVHLFPLIRNDLFSFVIHYLLHRRTSVIEDRFVSREKLARSSQSIILGRCHGVLVLWLFLECMRAPTATSEILIRSDFKKDLHSWQQYTKNIWADRFRTMWSESLKSTINRFAKIPLFRKCLNWYTPSVGLWWKPVMWG